MSNCFDKWIWNGWIIGLNMIRIQQLQLDVGFKRISRKR